LEQKENYKINGILGENKTASMQRLKIQLIFLLYQHIRGVSGGIVNILGDGSMDYSE